MLARRRFHIGSNISLVAVLRARARRPGARQRDATPSSRRRASSGDIARAVVISRALSRRGVVRRAAASEAVAQGASEAVAQGVGRGGPCGARFDRVLAIRTAEATARGDGCGATSGRPPAATRRATSPPPLRTSRRWTCRPCSPACSSGKSSSTCPPSSTGRRQGHLQAHPLVPVSCSVSASSATTTCSTRCVSRSASSGRRVALRGREETVAATESAVRARAARAAANRRHRQLTSSKVQR